jgi:hypothetical protein
MSLTDGQRLQADLYARVFPMTADTTAVLDDLVAFVNGMDLSHQAGAMRVITYVMLKRSALRRDTVRGKGK